MLSPVSRSLFNLSGILLCGLLLASCQKHEEVVAPSEPVAEPPPPAPVVVQDFLPLKTSLQVWERIAPACKHKDCAKASASIVQFPDKPDLSDLTRKSLLEMAETVSLVRAESLEAFADGFLKKAGRRDSIDLKATLLRQQGPLVAVQLDFMYYTGGAHENYVTAYVNYDRRHEKKLTLDDIVIDGQRPAFVSAEKAAHQAWMQSKNIDSSGMWPFKETDNFTLDAEGVRLKYQPYAIGPFAAGMPELLIPYAALQGILKPEWMLKAP